MRRLGRFVIGRHAKFLHPPRSVFSMPRSLPFLPSPDARVVIVGAGPTGLGAANRLHELGHSSWDLFEAIDRPGGLARSFVDDAGFTWDIGGHVQFSHYPYFDRMMDRLERRLAN